MNEKRRLAMCVEYDGTRHHGWQAQDGDLPTIQGRVERALSSVADHLVGVVCAGRTDTGVHACSQVIHFDTGAERSDRAWVFGANTNLPRDITVRWVCGVDSEFHARFSALERTYRFVIYNAPVRHSILRKNVLWHYRPLDVGKMNQAAQCLVGHHDFSSFRASGCQAKSPDRLCHAIECVRQGQFIVLTIRANAFLHHMVRNIVGTLLPIGSGLRPVDWMGEVLEAKQRSFAGATAPPHGLYFASVKYDDRWNLPPMPAGPFFL